MEGEPVHRDILRRQLCGTRRHDQIEPRRQDPSDRLQHHPGFIVPSLWPHASSQCYREVWKTGNFGR